MEDLYRYATKFIRKVSGSDSKNNNYPPRGKKNILEV